MFMTFKGFTWDASFAFYSFAEAKEIFSKANNVAGKYSEAAESPYLNRLVDINEETRADIRDVENRLMKADESYIPVKVDYLHCLRQFLPYWELRQCITLTSADPEMEVHGRLRTWRVRQEIDGEGSQRFKLRIILLKNVDATESDDSDDGDDSEL